MTGVYDEKTYITSKHHAAGASISIRVQGLTITVGPFLMHKIKEKISMKKLKRVLALTMAVIL